MCFYSWGNAANLQTREVQTRDNREMSLYLYLSLTSALDGVGGRGHALAPLTPGNSQRTHFLKGWEGLGAGLDGLFTLKCNGYLTLKNYPQSIKF
jgi:hypothetical protein